jgi:hypothetical protein
MTSTTSNCKTPTPLISADKAVDWWFAFKFNTEAYPGDESKEKRQGIFGGTEKDYRNGFSLDYVYAGGYFDKDSSDIPLQKGEGYLGISEEDPLGATFAQVYQSDDYYYLLWNDQFYDHPIESKGSPMGHSKGMLAWNDNNEGFVLQVSTPSWPGSGNQAHPRENDGNTLGCVKDDDVEVSQHFFALSLKNDDLVKVLKALKNASVVTDPKEPSLVRNGGSQEVQDLVNSLGHEPHKKDNLNVLTQTLSSGIKLIAKASYVWVPPWQMVSAQLDSVPLRVASWWAYPEIPSTDGSKKPRCWDDDLGTPGAVDIATTGKWDDKVIGLKGGLGKNYNHAKLGVSKDDDKPYCIFGDMNQQGALFPGEDRKTQKCNSSQNGRGGTFYVLENAELHKAMSELLAGESAPLE